MSVPLTSSPIKIVIVDDHPVIREGLKGFFSKQKSIRLLGEAADGTQALELIPKVKPEILLMDLKMPGISGLELLRMVRERFPGIRVLVVSVFDNRDYIIAAIEAGAAGYILKDFFPSDLLEAITTIHQGKTYFPPKIIEKIGNENIPNGDLETAAKISPLSKREKEVLRLIVEGQGSKQIAVALGIGVRTVETYRENIMEKLDIHSTPGLVRFALSTNLFDDI